MVAPSKNVIGKKKGTKDQGDSSEKFPETLRPTVLQQQARFSSLGNAQKLASKERACSSTNVECQHLQLGGVTSFRNSKLHHKEGISITPTLVNNSKTAHSSYSNVLKDDEACSNVLESGPWLFARRMVILKKCHPMLILIKETCSKILAWVKLFNIPHEYWNEE
ncbi:hypothetical protein Dsin_018607 [Dipteronia sinensis]|uniref:DUF4283 domain-containing protein n=1 Tax=Dipteronia sinensis TaxID=43782 RepID=A0AAE0A5T0_9ROSI|nr:hypothetical protein Dsin_018607 [Dipteronia sinensis]